MSNREWKLLYSDIEKLSGFYKISYKGNVIVDKIKVRFLKSDADLKYLKLFVENTKALFLTVDKYLILDFVISHEKLIDREINFIWLLKKRINDLIFAICIARKGALEISGQSAIFLNGKLYDSFLPMIHGINRAYERSKKIKWPIIRNLPLRKTISWLENFQEEIDGISTTKVGRALNAFSHLFFTQGGEGSAAELFWALVALEAIYVEGNSNLQGQLNSKSQLLLGLRKENKKAFSEMYDFRSRYIHGDLNFYNKFCIEENSDEFKNFIFNTDDNQSFAIAILLATFQKLITKNLNKLEFEFRIKNSR